ncbi:MAG: class I SAM-dependent methyltransferase [Phycisphaeraceae bacterium]|nr:class I SAM-dependent methyltransferase [Phycisphaeraceae bacterium]MCB9848081.1 class I SAM-dependent methyltransferase [Phycisphaeraceae bacterium]
MDFSSFDQRGYPVTDAASGYGEWAATYETSVRDEMDLRLLERVRSVDWARVDRAVDLACGTGRVGAWLRGRGVGRVDGQDLTPEMLDRARARGIYTELRVGDLRGTPFECGAYTLATSSLVDEHLADLGPLYAEAARLLAPGGWFVNIGMHPQFMTTVGMPTHYHRDDGAAITIETHLHTFEEHVDAGVAAGLRLVEVREGLIDEEYVAGKPKWAGLRGTPITMCVVWAR